MASPTIAANAYANNAYANLARILDTGGPGSGSDGGGRILWSGTQGRHRGSDGNRRKVNAQSLAMASGKANVMDVVTAVAETDVAVSTLVSVRDRVIRSYEGIMKMPI